MFENFLLRISLLAKLNLVSPFISFACPKETNRSRGRSKKRAACPKLHPHNTRAHHARQARLTHKDLLVRNL
jgi:hypothetical protein